MFEFIKRVFKREEPKRISGVTYAEVERIPIEKFEIKRIDPKKFEPKKFEYLKTSPWRSGKLMRMRYTDTDEIVELPIREAIDEFMGSTRPVVIEGVVD